MQFNNSPEAFRPSGMVAELDSLPDERARLEKIAQFNAAELERFVADLESADTQNRAAYIEAADRRSMELQQLETRETRADARRDLETIRRQLERQRAAAPEASSVSVYARLAELDINKIPHAVFAYDLPNILQLGQELTEPQSEVESDKDKRIRSAFESRAQKLLQSLSPEDKKRLAPLIREVIKPQRNNIAPTALQVDESLQLPSEREAFYATTVPRLLPLYGDYSDGPDIDPAFHFNIHETTAKENLKMFIRHLDQKTIGEVFPILDLLADNPSEAVASFLELIGERRNDPKQNDLLRRHAHFTLKILEQHRDDMHNAFNIVKQGERKSEYPSNINDMRCGDLFPLVLDSGVTAISGYLDVLGGRFEEVSFHDPITWINVVRNSVKAEDVKEALVKAFPDCSELLQNEWLMLLERVEEKSRFEIRQQNLQNALVELSKGTFDTALATEFAKSPYSLLPAEIALLKSMFDDIETKIFPKDPNSESAQFILNDVCRGDREFYNSFLSMKGNLLFSDALQLFFVYEKRQPLLLRLKILHLLSKYFPDEFARVAVNMGTDMLRTATGTALQYLYDNASIPDEAAWILRIAKRKLLHETKQKANQTLGLMQTDLAKGAAAIGVGLLWFRRKVWLAAREPWIKLGGKHLANLHVPSLPRRVLRWIPVIGDFEKMHTSKLAANSITAMKAPAPAAEVAKVSKAASVSARPAPAPRRVPPVRRPAPSPSNVPPAPARIPSSPPPSALRGASEAASEMPVQNLLQQIDAAKAAGNNKALARLLQSSALDQAVQQGDKTAQALVKARNAVTRGKWIGRGLIGLGVAIDLALIGYNEQRIQEAIEKDDNYLADILRHRRLTLTASGVSAVPIGVATTSFAANSTAIATLGVATAPAWATALVLAAPVAVGAAYAESVYGNLEEWNTNERAYAGLQGGNILQEIHEWETRRDSAHYLSGHRTANALALWRWMTAWTQAAKERNEEHYARQHERADKAINLEQRGKLYSAYFLRYSTVQLSKEDWKEVERRNQMYLESGHVRGNRFRTSPEIDKEEDAKEKSETFQKALQEVLKEKQNDMLNDKFTYIQHRSRGGMRLLLPDELKRADTYYELMNMKKEMERNGKQPVLQCIQEDGSERTIDLAVIGVNWQETDRIISAYLNEHKPRIEFITALRDLDMAPSEEERRATEENIREAIVRSAVHHLNRAEQRVAESELSNMHKMALRQSLRLQFEAQVDRVLAIFNDPESTVQQYREEKKRLMYVAEHFGHDAATILRQSNVPLAVILRKHYQVTGMYHTEQVMALRHRDVQQERARMLKEEGIEPETSLSQLAEKASPLVQNMIETAIADLELQRRPGTNIYTKEGHAGDYIPQIDGSIYYTGGRALNGNKLPPKRYVNRRWYWE